MIPVKSSEYLSEGLIKINKHFPNKPTHIWNNFIEVSNVVISRDNCFFDATKVMQHPHFNALKNLAVQNNWAGFLPLRALTRYNQWESWLEITRWVILHLQKQTWVNEGDLFKEDGCWGAHWRKQCKA